jgi:hypothetical protein
MSQLSTRAREALASLHVVERRASARYEPAHDINCQVSLLVGERPDDAKMLDVSRNGIGFLLNRPVDLDTAAIVSLTDTTGRVLCRELVCVRHVTQRAKQCYHVGCEFLKKLTFADLRALTPFGEGPESPLLVRHGPHAAVRGQAGPPELRDDKGPP